MQEGARIEINGRIFFIDEEDIDIVRTVKWTTKSKTIQGRCMQFDGQVMTMGRFILKMHGLLNPGTVVCHKNFSAMDNRKSNLIQLTKSECQLFYRHTYSNSRKQAKPKRDLPIGVYKKRNKYDVIMRINGKVTYCGTFKTVEEAQKVVMKHKIDSIVRRGCARLLHEQKGES